MRHLHAARPGRGGGLGADPAGPDHDQAPPAAITSRRRSQSSRVLRTWTPSRSAPGIGSRRGSEPVARSRRSQPSVSPSLSAAVRPPGSTAVTSRPAQELDLLLGVEPLGVDVDRVPLGPVLQVVLGERRALVGPVRLGPDEHHARRRSPPRAGSRPPSRPPGSPPRSGRSVARPSPASSLQAVESSRPSCGAPARPYPPSASGIRSCARTAWSVPLVAITRTSISAWPGKSSGSMRTAGSVRSSPTVRQRGAAVAARLHQVAALGRGPRGVPLHDHLLARRRHRPGGARAPRRRPARRAGAAGPPIGRLSSTASPGRSSMRRASGAAGRTASIVPVRSSSGSSQALGWKRDGLLDQRLRPRRS